MAGQNDWDVVKEFYKEKFGLGEKLVELNANYTILLMCASGAGNESISKFLDIPIRSIELVLNEVFDFTGWTEDLKINPYKIYRQYFGDKDKCDDVFWTENDRMLVTDGVYKMCEIMERIDKRLEDEWV